MEKTLLSICIPTYNRAETVKLCVDKILKNDIDYIEVVVSDNASPDHTKDILSEIKDERFKYYRNTENIGFANVNRVISEATGKWCLLIGDEDYILDVDWDKLKEKLQNSGDVAIFRSPIFWGSGKTYAEGPYEYRKRGTYEAFAYAKGYLIYLTGDFFRRDIFDKYEKCLDKNAYLYKTYPHCLLGSLYLQDWDCDKLECISFKMGEQNGKVFSDNESCKAGKSEEAWSVPNRMAQEADWMEFWASMNIDQVVKQRLIFHCVVNAVEGAGNACVDINDERFKGTDMYARASELKAKLQSYTFEDWEIQIAGVRSIMEKRAKALIPNPDKEAVDIYLEEIEAETDKYMRKIRKIFNK